MELILMIKYKTIVKAKQGNQEAINEILIYYMPKISKYSDDEDFMQKTLIEITKGIKNFKFFSLYFNIDFVFTTKYNIK